MSKWLLSYDLAGVLVFVVAGRANHGSEGSATGILQTAGPFISARVVGWLVTRAWQDPASLRTGAGVLAVTIVAGLLLRRIVFSDGIELTFVFVASAFLTLFLLGWRVAAMLGRRRMARA